VNIIELKRHFPQSKLIQWHMGRFRVPPNWQWSFWSAFECGIFGLYKINKTYKFLGNDQIIGYPCNTRVIVGIDRSNQVANYTVCTLSILCANLHKNLFQKQVDFILTDVFSEQWSNFDNLAILDYGYNDIVLTQIGLFKNSSLLEKYIRSIKQVIAFMSFTKFSIFRTII
jgi:hypothetical protein